MSNTIKRQDYYQHNQGHKQKCELALPGIKSLLQTLPSQSAEQTNTRPDKLQTNG
jgi:hypothetical protein